jgi:hypothetical protein
MIFFVPARRIPQVDAEPSAEDFDAAGAKKIAKPRGNRILFVKAISHSFALALLHAGLRRAKLAVLAPLRFTLLASAQNFGAQTIQSRRNLLEQAK